MYLPRNFHRRLRETAAEKGTTATALTLEAVNATHTQLSAALAHDDAGRAAGGDLFDIPQARTVAEPSVQTTIRVTDSQFRTLVDVDVTACGEDPCRILSSRPLVGANRPSLLRGAAVSA